MSVCLSYDEWRAINQAECVDGYRDGYDGWPARQGASRDYLFGYDNGRVDGQHQPEPTNNIRELLAELRRRGDSL